MRFRRVPGQIAKNLPRSSKLLGLTHEFILRLPPKKDSLYIIVIHFHWFFHEFHGVQDENLWFAVRFMGFRMRIHTNHWFFHDIHGAQDENSYGNKTIWFSMRFMGFRMNSYKIVDSFVSSKIGK